MTLSVVLVSDAEASSRIVRANAVQVISSSPPVPPELRPMTFAVFEVSPEAVAKLDPAAPRFVLAVAAVVPAVPPLAIGKLPLNADAAPVRSITAHPNPIASAEFAVKTFPLVPTGNRVGTVENPSKSPLVLTNRSPAGPAVPTMDCHERSAFLI